MTSKTQSNLMRNDPDAASWFRGRGRKRFFLLQSSGAAFSGRAERIKAADPQMFPFRRRFVSHSFSKHLSPALAAYDISRYLI